MFSNLNTFNVQTLTKCFSFVSFQLIAMLVLVIVLFMLCWSPYFFMLVLISFYVIEYKVVAEKVYNFFTLVAIMNSAINPLIYAFLSPTFRKSVIWAITSIFRRGKTRSHNEVNYTTTITGAASMVNHKHRNASVGGYS